MGLLAGEEHMAWMEDQSIMREALKAAGDAEDIAAMRVAFAPLSEALVAALKRSGVAPAVPVYVLRCPMAFGGRGARWMQLDREVRNPWFGAAMPTCGQVVETIPPMAATHEGMHAHE